MHPMPPVGPVLPISMMARTQSPPGWDHALAEHKLMHDSQEADHEIFLYVGAHVNQEMVAPV